MASSSDRDKDSKDSQPKPDNPFIKFRQFADSQISSLLQGIVGLPSAFTKSPNNARWAGFDEDMRRRDELQTRQNDLRESEARKAEQQSQDRWTHWLNKDSNSNTSADDEEMDDKTARDIPLYSPVAKSLFSRLRYAQEDRWSGSAEWRPVPVKGLNWPTGYYQPAGESDQMKLLRTAIYRDLNANSILRSQYSLLPYLLFSPYSPIKLDVDRGVPTADYYWGEHCEMFQDLILTTQGRPMNTWGVHGVSGSADGWGYDLIYRLWGGGVLQQSGTSNNPEIAEFQKAKGAFWAEVEALNKTLRSQNGTEDEDSQTEQEMYERFLRRASLSTGITDILESLFTDAEGWINKQLFSLDPAEIKRQLKEFTDFLERKTGDENEDKRRADASKTLEALFTQAVGLLEKQQNGAPEGKRRVEAFPETRIGKELEDLKRMAAADPKTVFTSTTTEHTTNEDGSVETSVTVWKRYADGRETTTKTSHVEEPACCDEEESVQGTKVPELKEEKKSETKGWFWN